MQAAMLTGYFPALVLLVVALALGGILSAGTALLGPKRPTAAKLAPYECGMSPVGTARTRFPIKFYLYAMLFLVFDIEAVFFYPWAVVYHSLRWFGFVEMFIFIVILLIGYFYIWKKGAFEWE
jgi:NADH-quinone oxidoreductase subunit A